MADNPIPRLTPDELKGGKRSRARLRELDRSLGHLPPTEEGLLTEFGQGWLLGINTVLRRESVLSTNRHWKAPPAGSVAHSIGYGIGLESPKMRREARQDELDETRLALAQNALADSDLQLRHNQAIQPGKTALALTNQEIALRQAQEQRDYAVAEPFLFKNRSQLGRDLDTIKDLDPEVRVQILQGEAGRNESELNAMIEMLESGDPENLRAAQKIAFRQGFALTQDEKGQLCISGNGIDSPTPLDGATKTFLQVCARQSTLEMAKAQNLQKQKREKIDGISYLETTGALRELGLTDVQAVGRVQEMLNCFNPEEIAFHAALRGAEQLLLNKTEPELRDEFMQQVQFVADYFKVRADGNGNIEGVPALHWVQMKLAGDPVEHAYAQLVDSAKREVYNRNLLKLAAARGSAGEGEALSDEDAQANLQNRAIMESGRKLAVEMGTDPEEIEGSVERFNAAQDDDEKKVPPSYGYDLLTRAVNKFAASIADGKSGENAYKDVVEVYEKEGFKESDVPKVFKQKSTEMDLKEEWKKRPALLARVAAARKKYPAGVESAKRAITDAAIAHAPFLAPEAEELFDANNSWNWSVDRIHELKQRLRELEGNTEEQQAYNERFARALQMLKGDKPEGKANGR